MAPSFKFQCPQCGRSYKANKDLGGRLKRCGKCRGTFTIHRTAPVKAGRAPEPVIVHDPELPIDQVFAALHEWQKTVPSLPGAFAREVTFGTFDPLYRVTLEVTTEADGRQNRLRAHRVTADAPGNLADASTGGRKVVDLRFEHTSQLAGLLADKPDLVRDAAERLAKEIRPPSGGRFLSRHLTVEHLQAWTANWAFRGAEGSAWFYSRPLRVHLPHPPRRSAAPAVLGTLAALALLAAAGYLFLEFDLIRPGALRPAPPPPAPVAAARPAALTFAKDGVLQLDDGSFLRGSLERKGDAVVVRDRGDSSSIDPWRIESLHVDAPVFLRGEAKRLDDLESRVKAAPTASRETLVGLFLEIHRQADRWVPLTALCRAGELPRDPQQRLESMRVDVSRLLEQPAVAAAPAPIPGAPAAPAGPPPAVGLAARLLGELTTTPDRAALAAGLQALRAEKLPQADLLEFAALYLGRSDVDAGLAVDRVHVKTPQYEGTFEGTFEKRSDSFAKLRTPSGLELTVYREKGAWVALIPGGTQLSDAQVTLSPAAPAASADRLKSVFAKFPPPKWMSASAAEHLKAAKEAAAPSKDRGAALLRALAAGHAGAALRTGTPAEILEARVVLHGLGYAQSADGRWERPEDRRAAEMGRLLADGKAEEARAMLPGKRSGQDFFGAYRAAALHLQAPLRSVEELDRAVGTLDQAIGQAATAGESKHLLALKSAVSGFGICASCGGNPAKQCTTCRGKGTRTEACLRCNGQGYIATVGIGATGSSTCPACGGKPIRGTRPCERCEGKGTKSCPKCQGATRLPAAADLARTRPCAACGGAGSKGGAIAHPCSSCAALGLQLVPSGAPDAVLP